jgi:hypothetical protein
MGWSVGSNLHYEIRYVNDTIDPLENLLKWLKGVYARRKSRNATGTVNTAGNGSGDRHSAVSGLIYCHKVCYNQSLYYKTIFIYRHKLLQRQSCEDIAKALRNNGIGARYFHRVTHRLDQTDFFIFILKKAVPCRPR